MTGAWPARQEQTNRVAYDEGAAVPVDGSTDELRALDERALLAACAAGRRDAFDELVVRHRRPVYQLCYRFVGNHEDASDLAQEVFLRAYRAIGSFKGDAAIGTWLHRIAVNACLNKLSVRRPPSESIDERRPLSSNEPDAVSQLLSTERAVRLRSAIAQLPPRQRATLILRVYQELPHQEIARVLGSSVGAVKANFFHAINNLRRLLRDER